MPKMIMTLKTEGSDNWTLSGPKGGFMELIGLPDYRRAYKGHLPMKTIFKKELRNFFGPDSSLRLKETGSKWELTGTADDIANFVGSPDYSSKKGLAADVRAVIARVE